MQNRSIVAKKFSKIQSKNVLASFDPFHDFIMFEEEIE